MTALLAAAVIAVVAFAYAQVRKSAVDAATAKLQRATGQIAEMLANSATAMGGAMRRQALKPEFAALLSAPASPVRTRAVATIDSMAASSKQVVDVQLWNAAGETIITSSASTAAVPADIRREMLRMNPAVDSGVVGRIHLVADTPVFVLAAPVMQASKVVGYLVERGKLSSSPKAASGIAGLIGDGSGVFISNTKRDVWSDFWSRATAPSVPPAKRGLITEYMRTGTNSGEMYGLEKAVPGTPWLILVELPRSAVLEPADIFLRDASIFAAVLLTLGAFGLWRLSRNITQPLSTLREVAVAITEGDYSRSVETSGSDELGQLGRAFETMATRVAIAQHTLQQQLAAMEESESRYRKITEASFDGIDIVVDDVVREANRGFAKIFGYSVDEVIGRPTSDFLAEESVSQIKERSDRQEEGNYEFVGKHKDGHKILLEGMTRIHNIDGRPGRITAFRDVTEKRALEAQFRQAQKMDAVGRLAGGVAHDFNNLLTVIMGCTDFLLQDETVENDSHREDLQQIKQASLAAASLTRQLLAFTRQEVIQPRLIEVNATVANAQNILKRLIGEDIELSTVLTSENPVVKIDRSQFEQVIVNLAVNARDAMPSGGKLTMETQTADVDEAYATSHWSVTPGRYAVLAVTDNGCGMDEETQTRIFEPFYTTKDVGKGTGLGLAMVYGAVKQSGGFIWVYSEPGKGTTFKIYLPLAQESMVASELKALPAVQRGTEVIVLAEDSPAVRSTARGILERAGYTVIEAPNGRTALEIARKRAKQIHLLLTDVVMPEMSGRKLSEEFAALRPDTRVLFMSGYTDDAIVRHGVMSAAVDYLQKPFSADSLLRKVRDVLDRG